MTSPFVLKTLEEAVEEMQAIPLWGSPPPFPLEAFAQDLAKALDVDSLTLSIKSTEYKGPGKLLEGMGESPLLQPFVLTPIPGPFFFVLPRKYDLSTLLLGKKIADETLHQGFLTFTLLNALEVFNRRAPYASLAASLADPDPLPERGAFCIDLSLQCKETPFSIRIIIPSDVHESFKSFFLTDKPPLLQQPEAATLPLSLTVNIGTTTLSLREWKQAKVGDCLLLDRCTYHPEQKKGTATLCLDAKPLFELRLKEGEIKILEHSLIQEEQPMVDQENSPPESEKSENEENPLWTAEEENKPPVAPVENVPLTLTVEVSRLQMPLGKVAELKPGNVLDLKIAPSPDVHLCAGGKRIAKGELVQIGEALGVKILQVGE